MTDAKNYFFPLAENKSGSKVLRSKFENQKVK